MKVKKKNDNDTIKKSVKTSSACALNGVNTDIHCGSYSFFFKSYDSLLLNVVNTDIH